ncbi:hypothetical protein V6615_11300 [Oscillospiraceae bacterium PP1C4]
MLQRTVAMLLAMGMVLFCAVKTSAQEIVTLPSGGLHSISAEELDNQLGVHFDMLTITLPPKPDEGVLYLDGKPLDTYRLLTRQQADRLMLFSSARVKTVSIGVTVPHEQPPQKKLKILCINRQI